MSTLTTYHGPDAPSPPADTPPCGDSTDLWCGEAGPLGRFRCTATHGHAGPHAAYGVSIACPVATWPQAHPPP